jgi:hypothetical protein
MITRQNTPCSEPMAFKNGDFHEAVRIGANLLKVLTDFDILLIRNYEPEEAIRIMSEQIGLYDRTLLNMLAILDLPGEIRSPQHPDRRPPRGHDHRCRHSEYTWDIGCP